MFCVFKSKEVFKRCAHILFVVETNIKTIQKVVFIQIGCFYFYQKRVINEVF